MRTKVFWGILIALGLVVAVISISPQQVLDWISQIPYAQTLKDRIYNDQYLPGPLRGSLDANGSQLTRDGVIEYTNDERSTQGLPPLHMNDKLNRAAQSKVNDMFAQQYFEHESPQGKTPADIIKAQNYEYLIVGENLALGNFDNDQALVEAWMNSPGHRANILNNRFQEIGVAVGRGTYEGKSVWLAVQEFGTPLSACPSPDGNLQKQIDSNRAQISTWETELSQLKAKIDKNDYASRQDYQNDRDKYNALVQQTNDLINRTKTLVDQYNQQVNAFNSCLGTDG